MVRRGLPIEHPVPEGENSDNSTPPDSLPELVDLDSELGSQRSSLGSMPAIDSGQSHSSHSSGSSVSAVQGEKRAAEGHGGGGKRTRQESSSGSSMSSLPGTGADQGDAGGGGISGGTGGVVPYTVPRPLPDKSCVLRRFNKSWKWLTNGVANNIISKTVSQQPPLPTYSQFFLTTALGGIPVHLPCLYMSPQEMTLIKPGEEVVEVKVKIFQRNVRVAFPTASTDSTLATLNQNKNTQFAVGLNLNGYGLDMIYEFSEGAPMVPTNVLLPTVPVMSASFTQDFYGVANNNSIFANVLPANATGTFIQPDHYWTASTSSLTTGGWPTCKNHWREADSADLVGSKIIDYSYKPMIAPLRASPAYRDIGAPLKTGTTSILNARGSSMGEQCDLNILDNNTGVQTASTMAMTPRTVGQQPVANSYYHQDIEKSQWMSRGYINEREKKVQPSVHVGVQAVPSLSTDATTRFVDVQGGGR